MNTRLMTHVCVTLAAVFLFSGCSSHQADEALVVNACARSAKWLDTVRFDVPLMRQAGIKGKKKVVELFEAYEAVFPFLPPEQQRAAKKRMNALAEYALRDAYHDMQSLDDGQFDEDATSYLRFCYLLSRHGYDTQFYRSKISQAYPRFVARLPLRGISQQMVFTVYGNSLGIDLTGPGKDPLSRGIIRQRLDSKAMSEKEKYDLTHEVFAWKESLRNGSADIFNFEDKAYLALVLKELARECMNSDAVDLCAEVLLCARYLNMESESPFPQALRFILSRQNQDGSFGSYESLRPVYDNFVKEGFYLHTTEVSLKAIAAVMEK